MVSEIKMYEYPKGTFVVEDSTGFVFLTQDFYDAMEFYLAEKEKAVPVGAGTDKKENYPVRV